MNSEPTPDPIPPGPAADLSAFLRGLPRPEESAISPLPLPEIENAVRQIAPSQDLVARFVEAATSAGLQVHRTTQTEWIQAIREILLAAGAKTVFVAADASFPLAQADTSKLVEALKDAGLEVKRTPDDETLFRVDASITGVSSAIAETGTIVCTSGVQLARGASLIPPLHIAVVAASQIVPDVYDCFQQLGNTAALPANVNLITGPSKTADIEGILVTGVHGPGEVHVVLVAPRSG